MKSALERRIILRHDVLHGCMGREYGITGEIVGVHSGGDGNATWHLFKCDQPVPRQIWRDDLGNELCDEALLLRSRWKAFDVGRDWPTSVDVLAVTDPTSVARSLESGEVTKLGECMCFTAASYARYVKPLEHLTVDWCGIEPRIDGAPWPMP